MAEVQLTKEIEYIDTDNEQTTSSGDKAPMHCVIEVCTNCSHPRHGATAPNVQSLENI